MNRRLLQLECDAERLYAEHIERIVDTDAEVRALLERWDSAVYAFDGDVPSDYQPDSTALARLCRRHPEVESRLIVEFLWRRERVRRDDPDLDRELTAIENRVESEIRGEKWKT